MKKILLSLLFGLLTMAVISQPSELTVFSDFEPFILKVDGKQINEKPATVVIVKDITATNIRLTALLTNRKNLKASINIAVRPSTKMRATVKQNMNRDWVIEYKDYTTQSISSPRKENYGFGNSNETQQESYKTTNSENNGSYGALPSNNSQPTITGQVNGQRVNVSTSNTRKIEEQLITKKSPTKKGSSRYSDNNSGVKKGTPTKTNPTSNHKKSAQKTDKRPKTSHQPETNYQPETENPTPMSAREFSIAKSTITAHGLNEMRLTKAMEIIETNYLLAEQIKEIMKLMDNDDSRILIAKFAYPYCIDTNNYYRVNNALDQKFSIIDLIRMMNAQ